MKVKSHSAPLMVFLSKLLPLRILYTLQEKQFFESQFQCSENLEITLMEVHDYAKVQVVEIS